MPNPRLLPFVVLAFAMAGCVENVIPGPVAQLARYQKAEAEGRPADIVSDALSSDCTGGAARSDACPKLHAVRARACLNVARAQTAAQAACPGPASRELLTCAAENYGAVLDNTSVPQTQRDEFREHRARADYCLANFASGAERQSLGQQAANDLAKLSPNAQRDQLAANVWLLLAQSASGQASCSAYRQAVTIARRGLAASPDADLRGGLTSVQNNATSGAARASCGRV